MNKKAQTFTLDLIVSISVFMVVLGIVMYLWDSNVYEMKKTEMINEMKKTATDGAEMLARTPGAPGDWYTRKCGNISSIGFAESSSDRTLNLNKTCALLNMGIEDNISYDCARYRLVGKSYEFYVSLTDLDNIPLNLSFCSPNCDGLRCFVGNKNYTKSSELLSITRTALLNDTIIKIKFTVHVKNLIF